MKIFKRLLEKVKTLVGDHGIYKIESFGKNKHVKPYFVTKGDYLVKWSYDFKVSKRRYNKGGFKTPAEVLKAYKAARQQARSESKRIIKKIQEDQEAQRVRELKKQRLLLGTSPRKKFFDQGF